MGAGVQKVTSPFAAAAFNSAAEHDNQYHGGGEGIYFHPTSALHLLFLFLTRSVGRVVCSPVGGYAIAYHVYSHSAEAPSSSTTLSLGNRSLCRSGPLQQLYILGKITIVGGLASLGKVTLSGDVALLSAVALLRKFAL